MFTYTGNYFSMFKAEGDESKMWLPLNFLRLWSRLMEKVKFQARISQFLLCGAFYMNVLTLNALQYLFTLKLAKFTSLHISKHFMLFIYLNL